MSENNNIVEISIDLLIPNEYQPRKNFNDVSLNELALSIKEYGILNPVLVRKKNEQYEIIAGERRVREAKMAGFNKIPAIIKNVNDQELAEMALIENLQRENITPIEEANSYKEILNLSNKTEQDLSKMIGKSQPFISNKLRLLSLPKQVQDAINNRKISERHARSLLTVKDENKQLALLERIINEKLTVKELDNIINENNISKEEIKKEEKESDNMNNGNFFPNFNNNIEQNNNNMSLNNMNMQTLNNVGVSQMPNMEIMGMNQPSQLKTVQNLGGSVDQNLGAPSVQSPNLNQPFVYNVEPTASSEPNKIPESVVNNEPITPIINPKPTLNFISPANITDNNVVTNPLPDIPLFSNNEQVVENNSVAPVEPEVVATPSFTTPSPLPVNENIENSSFMAPPIVDTPLFAGNNDLNQMPENQNIVETAPVMNQNNFEVPLTESVPAIEPVNKLEQITDLLNNNNINYKLYSNDAGHCIIIEL